MESATLSKLKVAQSVSLAKEPKLSVRDGLKSMYTLKLPDLYPGYQLAVS
jgi:hypothetical protein